MSTLSPRIAVVLGAYNGGPYIAEQLDTILSQTRVASLVLVADDNSNDNTREVLATFGGAISVIEGPRRGYAANYMYLLSVVPKSIDFVALSDQDDHWFRDKLDRAVTALSEVPSGQPALYGSQSWVCDGNLERWRLSKPVDRFRLGFQHALTQNFAGGNTFVLNRAALELVQATIPSRIFVHDWWLYILIAGAGGQVLYDETPTLLYRQHRTNLIGANNGISSVVKRSAKMLSGVYRNWNDNNFQALAEARPHLTPTAQSLLDIVNEERDASLTRRLSLMTKHGLHRQGRLGQLGLCLSLLLRKF